MAVQIKVGDKAPSFTGKMTDGQEVKDFDLAQHLGKGPIVLGFFPFAFSSVCEAQMCEMRDRIGDLVRTGGSVFGVSVDSHYALKEFHRANRLGFPLVSDYNREAVQMYGLYYENLGGLRMPAKRSTVVIDRQGRVAYVWATENPKEKPNIAEIAGVVAKLH